ncbi:hypothetical protein F4809DRAFT_625742 [Biscogniauxia mediterranea]|nr:hypothetical protein F4809DRAFT_625742 [Biscogniauxia mediterranea]
MKPLSNSPAETTTPAPHQDGENIVYLTGPKLWAVILSLCLAASTRPSSRRPWALSRASMAALRTFGGYGSSYLLTSTAPQPLYGKVYRIFDIKATFLGAVALFELGSLVSAAPSPAWAPPACSRAP